MKKLLGIFIIIFSVIIIFVGIKSAFTGFSYAPDAGLGFAIGYSIGGILFIVLGVFLIRLSIKKMI